MRAWWIVLAATGCYSAHPEAGNPCSADGVCPAELQCIHDLCLDPGTVLADARSVDSLLADAPADAANAGPPDAPVDPTLVGHWEFEDPPGDGALDSTGRGHTGVCAGSCPTLTAGKVGMAYHFDAASSQVLVVPDAPDFRGAYTIAGWMRPDASAANGALALLSKPLGTGTANSWQLEILTNDKLSLSGGTPHTLEGPVVVAPMVWHHVAGTWDGTTKILYLDGVQIAQGNATDSYDTHAVYLGADQNNGTIVEQFNGTLDDLRVYNRALTAVEIATLATP